MTLEKQPFEDVSPIKNGDFPPCDVSFLGGVLEGSSQWMYVVNNHGGRFRPLKIGLWGPFQVGCIFMATLLGARD